MSVILGLTRVFVVPFVAVFVVVVIGGGGGGGGGGSGGSGGISGIYFVFFVKKSGIPSSFVLGRFVKSVPRCW